MGDNCKTLIFYYYGSVETICEVMKCFYYFCNSSIIAVVVSISDYFVALMLLL